LIGFRSNSDDSFTKGCLLLTWETVSIFKSTISSGLEFFQEFHLLNVRRLQVLPQQLVFSGKDLNLSILCERELDIVSSMQSILHKVTFKHPNPPIMKIDSTIPLSQVWKSLRPPMGLPWRVLFLARYYGVDRVDRRTLECFDKWESSNSSILNIEESFDPANAWAAVGHAIGWESKLDCVCFQQFRSSGFGQLINALIANAVTIKTVIWCDYEMSENIGFEREVIEKSGVETFRFIRAPIELVHAWLEAAKHWPQICSIQLFDVWATTAGFAKFTDLLIAADNEAVRRHLRKVEYAHMSVADLSASDFGRIARELPELEEIVINESSGEAELFLRACLSSGSQVSMLTISNMMFKYAPDPRRYDISPNLVYLSFAGCAFTTGTLSNLLRLIVISEFARPIILDLHNLQNSPVIFRAFVDFSVDQARPNIAECDLSRNTFSVATLDCLFSFLFTQKRLRLLRLEGITADSPLDFLQSVVELVTALPLPGLDISGNFDAEAFTGFLRALWPAVSLRRLSVKGSHAGVPGMEALTNLLRCLPQITELAADGFSPTVDELESQLVLTELWAAIAGCKSLVAVDLPSDDARIFRQSENRTFREAVAALRRKPRPSTTRQRVRLLLKPAWGGNSSADLFAYAAAEELVEERDEYTPPKKNTTAVGAQSSIVIPSSLVALGEKTYQGCQWLETVTFESGCRLDLIEGSAFSLSGLRWIVIPSSVIGLGESCFYDCKSLESVKFENGSRVERIGKAAFSLSGLK
jgi:hypothetical protein